MLATAELALCAAGHRSCPRNRGDGDGEGSGGPGGLWVVLVLMVLLLVIMILRNVGGILPSVQQIARAMPQGNRSRQYLVATGR